MSRLMNRLRQLRLPKVAAGRFSPVLQPFGCLQAHSCLCPLQKPASGHPGIGLRKQGEELCGVFLEPAIAHFGVTELTFDDPKRMLHLGPHAGLEFFGFFVQLAPGCVFLSLALTRSHGHMPVHARGLRAFAGALIPGISKHNRFFTVQQAVALGDIIDVCRSADDGVHQAGFSVHPDMRLHAEMPLVAFLDLVHLGVTLTSAVLGGTWCCDKRGVHHGAGLEQQAVGAQLGVDDLQNLRAQIVLFEQMAKTQDADSIRNTLGTADAHEVTVKAGLEHRFFGTQVGQTKPLLQTMNAQHKCKIKWRASRLGHRCMRRYQCQQFAPRRDLLHLIEQDWLARAPRAEIKAEVCLFHAVIDCNLRAPVTMIGEEFWT